MRELKTKYINLPYGVCLQYGRSGILKRLVKRLRVKRYYLPLNMTNALERDLTTRGLVF